MLHHIDVSEKIIEFKQYLDTTDRIILSARFGDGKTSFLREVQNDEIVEGYKFFTVYPVNYVVSPNEDIFEYIKRDILVQLSDLGILDNIDMDALIDTTFSFADLRLLISFLLSLVPGGDFYDKLLKKVEEKKAEYDERKKTFEKYDLTFENQRGGLYENDAYTKLIRSSLDYIRESQRFGKTEDQNLKTVLVIEDLDRLDPAHLFRILNVVSAHIDSTEYDNKKNVNKLGFDRIVIVMDYNATRNLFYHFYGSSANYEGYMSKFLTSEPFYFSINEIAHEYFSQRIHRFIGCEEVTRELSFFNHKISSLSLRDIARIGDFDFICRKKADYIEIHNIRFSSDLQLCRLLLLMLEVGMTKKEVIKDIGRLNEQQLSKYLSLIHPAVVAVTRNPDIIYKIYQERYGAVCEFKENNLVKQITINKAFSWKTSNELQLSQDMGKYIENALPVFASNLNLAGLNVGD